MGLGTGGTRIGAVSVIIRGNAILVTHGTVSQRNSVNNGYTGFGGGGGHGVADVDVFGLLGNLEAGNMDLYRLKVLTHDGLPHLEVADAGTDERFVPAGGFVHVVDQVLGGIEGPKEAGGFRDGDRISRAEVNGDVHFCHGVFRRMELSYVSSWGIAKKGGDRRVIFW